MSTAQLPRDDTAKTNWARYIYGKTRGHDDYCRRAQRLEGMFLGGGLQWAAEDLKTLEDQGRMPIEQNEIMQGVNAATGYQIQNRMDIAFRPRGGKADTLLAKVRTKVAKQIADANMLHNKETDLFEDGLVQQRAFYDIRIDYSNNALGELIIDTLDPMDVIPDPDAKSYEPAGWGDVTVSRWMSLDKIEAWFGMEARKKVEQFRPDDGDFGTDDGGTERSKFGDESLGSSGGHHEWDAWRVNSGLVQVRVIDRQWWTFEKTDVAFYPTGEIKPINIKDVQRMAELKAHGCMITKKMHRRVKRAFTTMDVTLMEDYSPFPWFSVIGFFPYFRRGQTRGMVDGGFGPQEALNKLISQYIHIINSSANSGWIVWQNSLTNMTTDQLEETGASTGLVLEVREGANKPEKIQPNQIPLGVDKMIERMTMAVRDATVPEAARGINNGDLSGIATQSLQFASQQQLARPLDNLARTRHLLANCINWVITNYYDSLRVFRITEMDPKTGEESSEDLMINQLMPDGTYANDMTVGDYDVVVSDQPMQVTFENSQFQQSLEMRKVGVEIPDPYVVRYSSLADKYDIMQDMESQQGNPVDTAKAKLLDAQAEKTVAETINKRVEATYSATQAAQNIAAMPAVAPMADALLGSAGFVDSNQAPIVPQAPEAIPGIAEPPANTNPLTPQNPGVGLKAGIEAGIV